MNPNMIGAIVNTLLSLLPEDQIMEFTDTVIDFLEDKVEETDNKIDDAIVLPILALLRKTYGIEDGED